MKKTIASFCLLICLSGCAVRPPAPAASNTPPEAPAPTIATPVISPQPQASFPTSESPTPAPPPTQALITPITPAGEVSATPVPAANQPASPTQPVKTNLNLPRNPSQYPIQAAPVNPMPFVLMLGSPSLTSNYVHTELGCNWMGLAGQVMDVDGKPMLEMIIKVEGTLNGKRMNQLGMTGINPAYGPGGYEIELSTQVETSNDTIKVQLLDLNAKPLSNIFSLNTVANCQQNLIVLNFVDIRAANRVFLPQVGR